MELFKAADLLLFHMYSQFCEFKVKANLGKKLLGSSLINFEVSHGLQMELIDKFILFFHGLRAGDTPLCFLSRILGQKRSLERLKKYYQKFCLISWIAIINIYKIDLQLRVYYYIILLLAFTL
jgi:hypothetical protein